MKLALLVGANPRVSEGGPWIRLKEGNWTIGTVDVIDTELSVDQYVSSIESLVNVRVNNNRFIGPCCVKIRIDKRGTESHISVYAELSDGT